MFQELTVRHLNKPIQKDMDEDIEWVCQSLGLSSGRDVENVAPQVMRGIVLRQPAITAEQLAEELSLAISRVNYHLRNLAEQGLVYREKRMIFLRGGSMRAAVQELRKDALRILEEIELIATEIDGRMGRGTRE